MNLPSRHIRIAILMVISQVLLTGFSLYWLNGQFKEEKESLYSKLALHYKESQGMVIDSMLIKQFITPALGDSTVKYYNFSKSADAVMMADSFRVVTRSDSFIPGDKDKGKKAVVTIEMSSEDDSAGIFEESQLKRLEKEMLLRSVRLIIKHVDDSSLMHMGTVHGFEKNLDSTLFISDYESKLKREGLNFSLIWVSSGQESADNPVGDKIMTIGDWSDLLPEAFFKNYRPYLFGQILPQMLFALILILLTGSAFILAYKSMRKQMVLNEMRNNFISNISHELKTPVSTVKVALEALRNFDLKHDPVIAEEYLEMSSKEIRRLELLITKVLDNSIIEQDRAIIRFEKTDLADLIRGAVESLKPRINEANALVNFDPSDPLIVDADPLYLQGVIINLFDNSLKYSNGNPEIEVVLSEDNGNAVIVVSDNGPGIPEQFRKKVFEKFFRIPTSDIHNVKGYGLGLSYVALIIEMHNGTIEVKNNNTGCSFIIKIPIKNG
ncbi:MAG: HAMP domain-containing histidine kinase [Bacteroidales bacterium]|nr:HAMP domain-containing histidine kinase [Bacteroidales bacterium]